MIKQLQRIGLLLLCVLVAPAALAKVNDIHECGTVVDQPGKYVLTNDLVDCPLFGVEIQTSDVTLDLNGYTISCADNEARSAGVTVWGDFGTWTPTRNVTVRNGTTTGCTDGVVLGLVEDAKVTKMTSWGNHVWVGGGSGTGITVWYVQNSKITHNHVYGNAIHGIGSWESSGNLFKHNTSTDNGVGWFGSGIDVTGETNSQFLCNRVHGNVDGILLSPSATTYAESNGNLLRGNLVTGNDYTGIGMMGFAWDGWFWLDIPSDNTVRSNIVEANGWSDFFEIYYDLVTEDILPHPGDVCVNNWNKNQFGTAVFGPDGCFGVPVVLDEDDVCALDDDD